MLINDKNWFESKNRRLLLELVAIFNTIKDRFQQNSDLHHTIDYLKKTDLNHLQEVFLSPEGRQWISFTYRAIKDGEMNDSYLRNYSKWLGINRSDLLTYQIKNLNHFLVSIVLMSGKGLDSFYEFSLPDSGFFAGIDLLWRNSKYNVIKIDDNRVYLKSNKNNSVYEELDMQNESLLNHLCLYKVPKSKLYPFGIDLYSEVSRINFPGREHLNRLSEDNHYQINQQITVIEKALSYIKKSNESVFNYFCEVPNYFVPLIGPEGALPSSSNSSVDTMIWYSNTSEPLLVAEMIMHENSHQRLFRLQDIDPLIDSVKHGSGWDLCEIYSPWRDDPRPVNGVFHGFVVFSEVSKFWFDLIQSGDLNNRDLEISMRRIAMLVLQLEYAEKSLSYCSFTERGNEVFNYYSSILNKTLLPYVATNKLGELIPFFMEHHDQFAISESDIQTVVKKHKTRWDQKNGY
jgi:hypothetical protein